MVRTIGGICGNRSPSNSHSRGLQKCHSTTIDDSMCMDQALKLFTMPYGWICFWMDDQCNCAKPNQECRPKHEKPGNESSGCKCFLGVDFQIERIKEYCLLEGPLRSDLARVFHLR
jgi:hypothetical protein